METLEPGHFYLVKCYDGEIVQPIQFMKRVGESYPGNEGSPHPGTNCQEVIRVLINRVKYLDKQIKSKHNLNILHHLRESLVAFEIRAAERHNLTLPLEYSLSSEPEDIPVCDKCGHIVCPHGKSA